MVAAYAEKGTIFHACQKADVGRRTHYDWMKADDAYRQAIEDAGEAVADALEHEAMRRGMRGFNEPVFYQGEVCGTVRKFSDLLLIFLLKGLRPEKYRERVDHEHRGKVTLEQALTASREEAPDV